MKKSTVLITGASTGIGNYLALHLLDTIHNIVVIGKNRPKNIKNKNFHFYECDLEDSEKLKILVKSLKKEFSFYAFIHNAMSSPPYKPFLSYSEKDLNRSFNVGVVSAFLIIKELYSDLKKQDYARVILMGSLITQTGSHGQLAYLTAKSALNGLTKGLAIELAKTNITINTLLLGVVKTEKLMSRISDDTLETILEKIPTRKMTELLEVAQLVDYLLKKESSLLHGSLIEVGHGAHLKN